MIVHANSVAVWRDGWRAVLLFGPSGAGKSDLTLRLVQAGWRLVSDDYSRLWTSGGRLYARSPAPIRGRIEARGVGVLPVPALDFAPVALALDCVDHEPERLPAPNRYELDGVAIPRLALRPLEASAVAKLSQAVAFAAAALGAEAEGLYEAPSLRSGAAQAVAPALTRGPE